MQTILIYDGLYKKKVYLDALAEGLDMYRVHTLMKIFPHLFKPVFTSKELTAGDVIEMIVPVGTDDDDDKKFKLMSSLFDFVCGLSPQGKCAEVGLVFNHAHWEFRVFLF